MTSIIVDLKCPACGHTLGQEEHERVVANMQRVVEEKANAEIEQMKFECDRKIHDTEARHKQEFEQTVNQRVASQLAEKVEEERQRAVREKDQEREQEKTRYKLHIQRLEKDNNGLTEKTKQLTGKIEEQRKTIENIPPELRGTAGEIIMLDALHDAFPNDELVPKIVGQKMADVIQTIVNEKGEKFTPPIVWDRKMAKSVSGEDIYQAKKYKTTHNTDYCIIVTEKGITKKDSDNSLIGNREGIWLVHPTMIVQIAKIFRRQIIESAKQSSSNKDRASKQAKLYDFLKSAEYGRGIENMRNANSKLDELQKKEEKDHTTTWNNRKKFIDEIRKISEENQQKINDIMLDTTSECPEDDFKKEEE